MMVADLGRGGAKARVPVTSTDYLFNSRPTQSMRSRPHEGDDIFDDLWSGKDPVPTEAHRELIPWISGNRRYDSVSAPILQILGMFDSGTHLLGALLEANIGSETMRQICPNGDIAQEHTWREDYHCFFWKHETPHRLGKLLAELHRQSVANSTSGLARRLVTVALVRSPIAQLAGWAKAPYELTECFNQTAWWLNEHCQIRGDRFVGAAGVWNRYMQAYDELVGRSDSALLPIVVEYERLVLDPEPVIREIIEALGLPMRAFHAIEDSAKKDGDSHGRYKAAENIKRMLYLNDMGQDARSALCQKLDRRAMERHRVLVGSGFREYSKDCA